MAKAKRDGGLYYTAQGVGVDAEGRKVEGAPKPEPDTDPNKQPGASGPGSPAAMTMRLDDDSLRALGGKPAKEPAKPKGETGEKESTPAPNPNAPPDPSNRVPTETAPEPVSTKTGEGGTEGGDSTRKSTGSDAELPAVKDLPAAVAKLKTVKEVKAMAKRDDRVSAEKIYDARIAEIEDE